MFRAEIDRECAVPSEPCIAKGEINVFPPHQHRRSPDDAKDVMKDVGASLRLVCPFAKDYLARHPERREQNTAAKEAVVERESLESGETF